MSTTMIQIRNVPERMHRRLKARAALAGMTLSEYVLQELKKDLERPTRDELLERIATLPGVKLSKTPAQILREERERR